MKKLILIVFGLLSVQAQALQKNKKNLIHILPDAPSSFYHSVVRDQIFVFGEDPAEQSVQKAIKLGERNMNWLKYMNKFRDESHQLRLTKPGELTGVPITSPKKYNPEIIQAAGEKIQNEMPQELKDIFYSNSAFPQNPPVNDDTYIDWAKKVDKNYQTATRWMVMVPYLNYLKDEQANDVRGHYFLSQTENLESKLREFSNLSSDDQIKFSEWLQEICQNSQGMKANCDNQVKDAVSANQVYEFYLKYMGAGEELWNSYFSLHNPRPDMEWTNMNPLSAVLPFLDPGSEKIKNFLKVNIEDEWKWDGWHLSLDFRKNADVHVEFQPGVTPHVNDVGGNTITMDDNAPLTEWDVQWTIRHEFGHVLGFVDCYVEFYDVREKAIINYQLDLDNLMCSRRGRMLETHYTTLKASYLR
jgi:hypothetical protein